MGLDQLLEEKREEILRLCAKHGARNVRVFGSVVRGEARAESDVDFLVEMEPGRSLFDLGGLLMDLQDLLGCKVDVVTGKGLHWYIRDRVLAGAVPLERLDDREPRRLQAFDGRVATVKDDRLYLIRILEFCERINSCTLDGRDAFLQSDVRLDAARFNLGMIGRMAKSISGNLKSASPEIPWERLVNLEAMLGLDDLRGADEVWNILEHDLPDLKCKIEAILKELGEKQ
jgi:hypothetical protein